jgi:cytoplasmic iron level regulating protein YaaA (DUF328/UPF0246 family)
MLAVISPAKSLDYKSPHPPLPPSRPAFEADAVNLARAASKMSARALGDLMHISDSLARLNVDRFRSFDDAPRRSAIFAFSGDVYVGFEAKSLDDDAILYAQDHLRILSGLYGLLRPLDEIRPYRLELGTKWAPRRKSLYDWWRDRIAARLAEDAEAAGGTIVNLASKEYWTAVDGKLPADLRIVDIDFREDGPDGLRFNSFAAKRARGMMARYICEHRIDRAEGLKGFDSDGYAFDPHGSSARSWRFCRSR